MLDAKKLEEIQKIKSEVECKLKELNALFAELEMLGANPEYKQQSNISKNMIIQCTVTI